MVKLSVIHRLIGNYLELHGDKDVTSIATWCGSSPNAYTLHLHDIYDGSIGSNPYTGANHLDIPKYYQKKCAAKTKAWMEDKGTWLFDLAHGSLDDDAIVGGFLKHYAMQGLGINDVRQDLHFRTCYGDFYMESAMVSLRKALESEIAE